jgi:hypothetical protein
MPAGSCGFTGTKQRNETHPIEFKAVLSPLANPAHAFFRQALRLADITEEAAVRISHDKR